MMTEKEAVGVSYSDKLSKDDENICFTALRGKFDKWCVEEAQKAGVIYAPRTLVKNAIVKNNFVIGVKTFDAFIGQRHVVGSGFRRNFKTTFFCLAHLINAFGGADVLQVNFPVGHS